LLSYDRNERKARYPSQKIGRQVSSILNCGGIHELNYGAVWKLMADLVAELRKRGEPVPPNVMRDLRSAKTMLEILRIDRSRPENLLRTEEYLGNVESYLVPTARKKLGDRFLDAWLERLAEAQESIQPLVPERFAQLPIGIPREDCWIRIEPSENLPTENIKQLTEEMTLNFRTQEDGCVIVYGEEEKVKRFVKRTAKLLREGASQ